LEAINSLNILKDKGILTLDEYFMKAQKIYSNYGVVNTSDALKAIEEVRKNIQGANYSISMTSKPTVNSAEPLSQNDSNNRKAIMEENQRLREELETLRRRIGVLKAENESMQVYRGALKKEVFKGLGNQESVIDYSRPDDPNDPTVQYHAVRKPFIAE